MFTELPEELKKLSHTDFIANQLFKKWNNEGKDFSDTQTVLDFSIALCILLSKRIGDIEETLYGILGE